MIRPLIPITDYLIHYDYIAEKLCKNKNKPLLKCYGSCYVQEKLVSGNYITLNHSDNSKETTSVEVFFPIFILNHLTYILDNIHFKTSLSKPLFFNSLKKTCFTLSNFKPPKF